MENRDIKECTEKCFTGLCQYAAQLAAAGKDTTNLRTFAVQMTEFWGLDNVGDGKRYEREFDRTVEVARDRGTAPELTVTAQDDVIRGLNSYKQELECVGGTEDRFYKRCEAFLDSLKTAWDRGDQAMLDRRLDECLLERFRAVGRQPGIETLHDLGHFISMHDYLTGQQPLDEKDISRLLRFQDPLEVAVDCAEGYSIQDLDLGFLMDRKEPEVIYPMAVDEMPVPKIEPASKSTEKKQTPAKGQVR